MMAAVRKSVTWPLPVVVVLGATGVGKSKLAIQIAKQFNGEIISADSMQVYQGLDIVTNKVSAEEQAECPHHLIDCVSSLHLHYTVVDYQKAALPIIDRLLEEKKLPVIVGGTNYYIESLVWNYLLTNTKSEEVGPSGSRKSNSRKRNLSGNTSNTKEISCDEIKSLGSEKETICAHKKDTYITNLTSNTTYSDEGLGKGPADESQVTRKTVESNKDNELCAENNQTSERKDGYQGAELCEDSLPDTSTCTLFSRLKEVDPNSARRIHPNDRRKIIRALEVYDVHGLTMTEMYRSQHGGEAAPALSGPLRYGNICVLWIQCQQQVLDIRLDERVDEMMKQGLIRELEEFHIQYNSQQRKSETSEVDYTLGFFQNIGFKEFHKYLILPNEDKSSTKGKELYSEGLEEMKRVTRKYAKKQIRWIRNRFLKRPGANVCPVYSVDGTDISTWEENVHAPAVEIISAIMEGRTPSQEPLPLEPDGKNPAVYNVCEVCDGKVFVTLNEWKAHMSSRKHKRCAESKKKKEKGLSYLNRSNQTDDNQSADVT